LAAFVVAVLDLGVGLALFPVGLAGAVLRDGALPRAVTLAFALDALLRAGALLADFFVVLLLAEAVALDLVALRAGAFSAAARLTIGLGRADLPDPLRPFDEDADADV
jgi:hypothetical protein